LTREELSAGLVIRRPPRTPWRWAGIGRIGDDHGGVDGYALPARVASRGVVDPDLPKVVAAGLGRVVVAVLNPRPDPGPCCAASVPVSLGFDGLAG